MRYVENLCWLQIRLLQRICKESKKHHVRQRAHCILLSYQRFEVADLARIFGKTERTIYTWLDSWETQHFAGLYDEKGRGRKPKLDDDQRRQVKEWAKEHPRNPRKVAALVREEYGMSVSKYTIQRILRGIGVGFVRSQKENQTQKSIIKRKKSWNS